MSMFIGQGLSLEARCSAQAERRAANTATAAASEASAAAADSMAAAAADSTVAAAALTERASSASQPFFAPLCNILAAANAVACTIIAQASSIIVVWE